MNKEILERKKELESLIHSLTNLKNKDCLSKVGEEYLYGLEKAYNLLFPIQVSG